MKSQKTGIDICIDFDGSCVTHEFPDVGQDIGAAPVLKELVKNGHNLILFTMRSNNMQRAYLDEAVDWFRKNDIPLYGIQSNPTQTTWTTSPKAYASLYIDDAALGAPLLSDKKLSSRDFLNWKEIRRMLAEKGLIK